MTEGRPGRPATIRQVAAEAGVSRATASRVINGGHLVSPQAKAAVEAAIARLGFTPNPAARSLVTRRTGSVALVVPEPNSRLLTDPFFGNIINGLSIVLEAADVQMALLITRDRNGTDRALRYLTAGHVDGAVVASHHRDDRLNAELVDAGLPVVFIGRPFAGRTRHVVDMDNTLGGRLATEHLVSLGRRRIATVAGPADMTAGVDRLTGWREAMAGARLAADALEHGDFTVGGGAAATDRLLQRHPDLDAVFAASDLMAAGVLAALAAAGRRVPEDVAVVGFDDLEIAESTRPTLTTVVQPVGDMAQAAGRMLLALLADPTAVAVPELFSPRLVRRESA